LGLLPYNIVLVLLSLVNFGVVGTHLAHKITVTDNLIAIIFENKSANNGFGNNSYTPIF